MLFVKIRQEVYSSVHVQTAKVGIAVVGNTGKTIRQKLQRYNPFKKEKCRKKECAWCVLEVVEGSVFYQILCGKCESKYV